MFNLVIKSAIWLFILKIATSCEPPDCDQQDFGTCGNACCTLELFTRFDPLSMNSVLSKNLQSGGPDKHYTFVGSEDLRPYNISASFILQGIHTTLVKKYNDTLNFVIYPVNTNSYFQSKIRAFSISQIKGAYGDDGQNYKNLVLLMKSFGNQYVETVISGCPVTLP